MNFYNDDEKKEGAPVIPGAASPFKKTSAFGKSPMFSRAAGSVFDRLKNLSRKDMAFVGIGLSILVMAPVAEYMMNQPPETNMLTGDEFKGKRGDGPLDPGINSLSAGSSDGSGEVITPLSSRDPASLILGSQPAQPVMPPASSTPPPQSNWRDSVKDAARESFSAAAKSAGAPTPIPKMQAGLRGLFGGGESSRTSGGLSGGKIISDAQSAPNKAAKRSMVGPVAMAGYKGVASNTPNSASKGAFEKLRSQADKSAGYFSGGSAMNSLDKAAAEAVNVGAGGGGAGGLGDGDKTGKTGNSSVKGYDRNINPKETLEEMAAKQRMNKALEWEFFKKYEIPKQIINAVVGKVAEWFGKQVERGLNGPGGAPTTYICALTPPAPADCNNPIRGPRSADPETVKKWDSKTCPCGVYSTDEWPGGSGTPATNTNTTANTNTTTNTNTNTNTGGAQAPEAAPVFKDFDTAMVQILENINAGVKTSSAKDLMTNTKAISKGFSELRADRVVNEINNRTAITSRDVAAYKEAVIKGRQDFDAAWNEYKVFKVQLQRIKTAAENGTLYVGSVNGISADATQAVKPDVQAALDKLAGYETTKIAVGDAKLKFHEAAYPVYESQVSKVLALAGPVSQEYTGNIVGQANAIKAEMERIEGSSNGGPVFKPEDITSIKEKFLALSGADTPNVKVPTTVTASLPPADLRTAVGAASAGPLVDLPIRWRGIGDPALDKGVLNDAAARTKEGSDWGATSPATKGGDASKVVDLDNMAQSSLLAASMRGIDEIRNDAKNATVDPATAVSLFNPVKEEMVRIKKVLETWKIDLANPTNGAATTTPTNTVTTTGTGTGTGAQPVNVTVNVNNSVGANATNTTHNTNTAAAVNTKPKPKPQGNTGTGTGTGTGLDTNKVNLYQRGMQTQNDAIKAARQAMNNAKARADAAKAQFDAAYNTCNSTCSKWPAFSQDTCWAGCKVTTGFNKKEAAFTMASDEYSTAISFVSQKKAECSSYLSGTVESKYRSIAGSCLN